MSLLRSLARRWLFTFNTIRYRVEWPRLEEALRKTPLQGTLFDGGAGSGEFIRRAMGMGFSNGVALEFDASNYRQLAANAGRLPQVKLIHGSLLEVPLADTSADVVMSTQVLEHIADHEQAASELRRVLKPGGYALITVPRPPEPFSSEDHEREGYLEEELAALFVPHGFELIWQDYFLTRNTSDRMLKAASLPLRGQFVPVAWVDAETHLTREQRRADTPYGMLMLFRKS